MTVALGIVTCRRPSYYRRTQEAILEQCSGVVDHFFAHVDGPCQDREQQQRYLDLARRYRKQGVQVFTDSKNRGVAKAKNALFRRMLATDADWLFLVEDDIIAQSPDAVAGYLRACEETGLQHMAFAHHGPGNQFPIGYMGTTVEVFPDYVGAWCVYSREALEVGGLMDEGFSGNCWEHVEHSVRLGDRGYTTQWKAAPDALGSEYWLKEIAESIEHSSIPDTPKRQVNSAKGREYWRHAHPESYDRVFDAQGLVRQNVPVMPR